MAQNDGKWLWQWLRRRKLKELDRLEASLIKRPFERREFAGDPQQASVFRVKTRNKGGG